MSNAPVAKSDVVKAMGYLAFTMALIATFFLTPLLFLVTIDWIQRFTAKFYEAGFEDLVSVAWFSTTGASLFFVFWALLATLLRVLAIRLATRIV